MAEATHKVVVALSGGVDSAVAAALLCEAGYAVHGVFLRMHEAAGEGADPAADARRVTEALGIGFDVVDAGEAFGRVVDYFAAEYAAGRTPNPCARCNVWVKFPTLLSVADRLGVRLVATGHYARRAQRDSAAALARGRCRHKDQSYALFALPPAALERLVLPVGELSGKDETRRIARRLGLPASDRPESQDVCFIPDSDYRAYLARRAGQAAVRHDTALAPGPIEDMSGAVLGTHDGYAHFTVGQRRGLGVAASEPLYVTRIDPDRRAVVVAPRDGAASRTLTAGGACWQQDVPERFDATVQVRYNHLGAPARVRRIGDETFDVRFDEPVHAPAPGQAAVCYDGDVLLGGGWIEA
ncbi:MAG: tRNA 2-thiouridine(34) synthase MnmA [Phycisphaerae bacterium]|nr:tRNA 2-thiouridine(34) synthase MnmA [Phycisphaerae bacterium]